MLEHLRSYNCPGSTLPILVRDRTTSLRSSLLLQETPCKPSALSALQPSSCTGPLSFPPGCGPLPFSCPNSTFSRISGYAYRTLRLINPYPKTQRFPMCTLKEFLSTGVLSRVATQKVDAEENIPNKQLIFQSKCVCIQRDMDLKCLCAFWVLEKSCGLLGAAVPT